MRERNGYSQHKFNYIKDYAQSILEECTRMEMAWQNSETLFKDSNITIDEFLENASESLNVKMEYLKCYLEPIEEFR